MKVKIALILFTAWLVLGLGAAGVYYQQQKTPSLKYSKNALYSLAQQQKSSGELMDALPKIFDREPALAAAFLANNQKQLIGSMYEPQRLAATDYKNMVNNFQRLTGGKINQQYRVFKVKLNDSYQVYLVSYDSLDLVQAWYLLNSALPHANLYLGGYILVGSGLLILLLIGLFTGTGQKKPPLFVKGPKRVKANSARPLEKAPQPQKPVISSDQSLLFSNQLAKIMNEFYDYFPYKKMAYYSRENNQWLKQMQKQGQVFIKGDSVVEIPGAFATISDLDNWKDFLLSPGCTELILPVRRKNQLIGAFYMVYSDDNRLPEERAMPMQNAATTFARSIFIQKTYEKAIHDDETTAVTYPYFYFAVKERVLSEAPFATLVFKIKNMEHISPMSLKKFTMAVNDRIGEFNQTIQNRNLFARIADDQFAIIFAMGQNGLTLQEVVESSQQVKQLVSDLLQSNTYGAIVVRPPDLVNADHFMKRLQYSLQKSLEQKSFGMELSNQATGVL